MLAKGESQNNLYRALCKVSQSGVGGVVKDTLSLLLSWGELPLPVLVFAYGCSLKHFLSRAGWVQATLTSTLQELPTETGEALVASAISHTAHVQRARL